MYHKTVSIYWYIMAEFGVEEFYYIYNVIQKVENECPCFASIFEHAETAVHCSVIAN